MMFDLPDFDELYRALVDRDPAYDGRAYVGVTSTGIFCRLTCPARKPKPENCQFFETPAQCLEAGFRPCKRCHPLDGAAGNDPLVRRLLAELQARPGYRWSEADLQNMGLDPSTVRRAFRRQMGMTFLEMARQARLRESFTALKAGEPVIAAQIDAGFESPAAFRAAFARLVGLAPGRFRPEALLKVDWIDTSLGAMVAVACAHKLHLLEFLDRKALPTEVKRLEANTPGGLGFGRTEVMEQAAEELGRYFNGTAARFATPLALHGTPFRQDVWRRLIEIPAGETRSYSALAQALGRPSATRAVAQANGANQIAVMVPCHRVVGADGSLTGYGGGLWRKQRLIEIERGFAAGGA